MKKSIVAQAATLDASNTENSFTLDGGIIGKSVFVDVEGGDEASVEIDGKTQKFSSDMFNG
jgi:hypothetical protein